MSIKGETGFPKGCDWVRYSVNFAHVDGWRRELSRWYETEGDAMVIARRYLTMSMFLYPVAVWREVMSDGVYSTETLWQV